MNSIDTATKFVVFFFAVSMGVTTGMTFFMMYSWDKRNPRPCVSQTSIETTPSGLVLDMQSGRLVPDGMQGIYDFDD